jgi:hypothetical protein
LSKPRRQHFIPRFYLKNFADPKIFCYDKTNDHVISTNIKDIALGKNFYEFEGLEAGLIEKFLSKNESDFSKAYQDLVNKRDVSKLSEKSVIYFFLFLAELLLRTEDTRLEIANVASSTLTRMYSKPINVLLEKKT